MFIFLNFQSQDDVEGEVKDKTDKGRIQIGTIRPIQVDHTIYFNWILKLIHSFIHDMKNNETGDENTIQEDDEDEDEIVEEDEDGGGGWEEEDQKEEGPCPPQEDHLDVTNLMFLLH